MGKSAQRPGADTHCLPGSASFLSSRTPQSQELVCKQKALCEQYAQWLRTLWYKRVCVHSSALSLTSA
jgi:hypothetical protein